MRLVLTGCLLWVAILCDALTAQAQSTAEIVVDLTGTGTAIRVSSCNVSVGDTLPEGIFTNSALVRFTTGTPPAPAKAPFAMRLVAGANDQATIAAGEDSVRLLLTRAALRGGELRLVKEGESGSLCIISIEEEDEVEIDPAFQLLAGAEFLSIDGFENRELHIPASAQWIIPVHVMPAGRKPRDMPGPDYLDRRWKHWYKNPYALLTTSAEYTRVPGEEQNFSCVSTTILQSLGAGSVPGTQCSPDQPKGTDSLIVFREEAGDVSYGALSTWRITSSYRREGNLGWADNDVYAGPMITLGLQTDPGIGSPDFFAFYTLGLSLTQVEITEEAFTERFNLQLAWGQSPNYSEKVVHLPDSTERRTEIKADAITRTYVTATFQPREGYLLRGSAEFGKGVPDVARLSILMRLDLGKVIGGIFGDKEPVGR
jgi:hypothetical protein